MGSDEGQIKLCPEGDSLGVSDEAMLGTVLDNKEGVRLERSDGREVSKIVGTSLGDLVSNGMELCSIEGKPEFSMVGELLGVELGMLERKMLGSAVGKIE